MMARVDSATTNTSKRAAEWSVKLEVTAYSWILLTTDYCSNQQSVWLIACTHFPFYDAIVNGTIAAQNESIFYGEAVTTTVLHRDQSKTWMYALRLESNMSESHNTERWGVGWDSRKHTRSDRLVHHSRDAHNPIVSMPTRTADTLPVCQPLNKRQAGGWASRARGWAGCGARCIFANAETESIVCSTKGF